MIVCDLDRTLLNRDGALSEYTLDVWEKCRQMGILLAFATARPNRATRRFVEVARPDVIITDGGALALVDGVVVYRAILPGATVNKILQILKGSAGVSYITASADHGHFTNYPIDPDDAAWAEWKFIFTDFSEKIDCDIYKIGPEIFDKAVIGEITALPDVLYTPFSSENWCSFNHAGATKWQAVQKVAQHLNIDTNSIAAFGDDFSDIEMLQNCGVGVAVANAIDEVKVVADFVCDSNGDDGVARWLEANLCKLR